MGLYADLTTEQKADIALAGTAYRGMLSSIASVIRSVDWDNLNQFVTDNVDGAIESLDAGQEIPNSSGLGGAKDLTKAQWQTLQTFLRVSLVGTLDTNRDKLVKAVGVNA